MKFITLENGYRYDGDMLDALKAAKAFERRRETELRNLEKYQTLEERQRAAYGAWMLGRRSGEFGGFYLEQRTELHTNARTYTADGVEYKICTCGLVVETATWSADTDHKAENLTLLKTPGHIRVSDRSVQTIFVINKLKQEAETESRYSFYCQTCGELLDAPIESYRDENQESLATLAELRSSHICR